MAIEVLNRQRRIRGFDTKALRRRAELVARLAGIESSEVCVTLVSDARIRKLSRDYRGIDRATDVLSFAQSEGEHPSLHPELLGDVVVSLERADEQRGERSLLDEATALLVHGVLHLLGHDHERGEEEAERMAAEERRLMEAVAPAERT